MKKIRYLILITGFVFGGIIPVFADDAFDIGEAMARNDYQAIARISLKGHWKSFDGSQLIFDADRLTMIVEGLTMSGSFYAESNGVLKLVLDTMIQAGVTTKFDIEVKDGVIIGVNSVTQGSNANVFEKPLTSGPNFEAITAPLVQTVRWVFNKGWLQWSMGGVTGLYAKTDGGYGNVNQF